MLPLFHEKQMVFHQYETTQHYYERDSVGKVNEVKSLLNLTETGYLIVNFFMMKRKHLCSLHIVISRTKKQNPK